jgi:dynein assembly factor 1
MSTQKPKPEIDEKGHPYITEKFVSQLCEYNGYYYPPNLNANLHLHYKGFSKIQNLEAFINVKVLYLENNCISKIENLSHMKQLSCL